MSGSCRFWLPGLPGYVVFTVGSTIFTLRVDGNSICSGPLRAYLVNVAAQLRQIKCPVNRQTPELHVNCGGPFFRVNLTPDRDFRILETG